MVVSEPGRTFSNGFKLDKFRFNRDIGKDRFPNIVVDEWNRFNSHVVRADTIDIFKKQLDKFMDREGRRGSVVPCLGRRVAVEDGAVRSLNCCGTLSSQEVPYVG